MYSKELLNYIKDLIVSRSTSDDRSFWQALNKILLDRGLIKSPVNHLSELPMATEDQFRTNTPTGPVFRTSGTTQEIRGSRPIHDYPVYELSVKEGFKLFCLYPPRPEVFISLVPSASVRPDSSLSHMVSIVSSTFFPDTSYFFREDPEVIYHEALYRYLEQHINTPVFIFATQLDLDAVLNRMKQNNRTFKLARGSRILFTGGSKQGQSSPDQVIANASELFGIQPVDIIGEFGMTELFSQAYDIPILKGQNNNNASKWSQRYFINVPWMRTFVVDPVDLSVVDDGQEGLLLHIDLANGMWEPVILSSDIGVRIKNGFRPLRRVKDSAPRGCSQDSGQ